jgi:hypothetical protein
MKRMRLGLVAILIAFPARADSVEATRARCLASYESAQVLRREEHLEAARAQLQICGATCPETLARDCARWLVDVDALRPTVRFVARDPSGQNVTDVMIKVDDRLLVDHAGASFGVEPGAHVFRFERRGFSPAEVRAEVHAGERDRAIGVLLSPLPPEPAVTPPAHSTTASYVLGGIGVLAIKGEADRGSLRSSCAPSCDPARVDAIRTLWWTAAGVGAAGAVTLAIAVLLWPPRVHDSPRTAPQLAISPRSVAIVWKLP